MDVPKINPPPSLDSDDTQEEKSMISPSSMKKLDIGMETENQSHGNNRAPSPMMETKGVETNKEEVTNYKNDEEEDTITPNPKKDGGKSGKVLPTLGFPAQTYSEPRLTHKGNSTCESKIHDLYIENPRNHPVKAKNKAEVKRLLQPGTKGSVRTKKNGGKKQEEMSNEMEPNLLAPVTHLDVNTVAAQGKGSALGVEFSETAEAEEEEDGDLHNHLEEQVKERQQFLVDDDADASPKTQLQKCEMENLLAPVASSTPTTQAHSTRSRDMKNKDGNEIFKQGHNTNDIEQRRSNEDGNVPSAGSDSSMGVDTEGTLNDQPQGTDQGSGSSGMKRKREDDLQQRDCCPESVGEFVGKAGKVGKAVGKAVGGVGKAVGGFTRKSKKRR